MAYSRTTSDRGMFDPNFPLQGIFDDTIFDTELVAAFETRIIPAYVHDNSGITVQVHSTEAITVR